MELLVVIGIIGILAGIATPVFLNAQREAQIGTLHSDISSTVIDTATRQNSNFGDQVLITGEEFNSYKATSAGNTISLVVYTQKDGDYEYCIEGFHTFSETDQVFLSYNLTTKEYVKAACSHSAQVLP